MNISAPKQLFRELDCCRVFGSNHLLLSSKPQLNSICRRFQQLLNELCSILEDFFLVPPSLLPVTEHRGGRVRVGEQDVMFHFRKTKIRNYKSIHKSVFSPPSEGAAGFTGLQLLSHTTRGWGITLTLPLSLAAGR